MSNFKMQYLNGEIPIEKLDDFVEEWHSSSNKESLQDFLGLTDEEFVASGHGLSNLKKLLDTQKHKATANINKYSKAVEKHLKKTEIV